MSEKRFICGLGFPINSDDPIRIISDSVEDKDYYKFSDICNVLNEQQATIDILLEELINAQQQGYVVGFLHKNGRCNLLKGDE